jgi:hypothetical protein
MTATEKYEFAKKNDDACAVAYYSDNLQVVALYLLDVQYSLPVPYEIRTWRATSALAKEELVQILDNWSERIPSTARHGIGSEEVRGAPIGKIHRAMQSEINRDTLVDQGTFKVPCADEINGVIDARLIPDDWRNSRDFRAHARELRAISVYLPAVFREQSVQPMRAVSESEDVTIEIARKIIDQARSHGYLTRADGAVGGTVTDKARSAANIMMLASAEAKKAKK